MDIGSGAGLPGIVLAAMRPGVAVELVEPMERRVRWLEDAVAHLDLRNVTVTRARVEELAGQRSVDRVSARAVAPLAKLVKWAGPVLKEGGQLLALKGQLAEEELRQAEGELQRCSFRSAEVRILETVPGVEPTRVVVATRAEAGARGDG
jgi:16S rRNA (guanine527-N7)-methyltransferase